MTGSATSRVLAAPPRISLTLMRATGVGRSWAVPWMGYRRCPYSIKAKLHVRTLLDHLGPGGVPAAVPLPGAAELPAALQRGADPAGADRSHGRGGTAVRAGALGV